jgi:hypothetical protein
MRLTAAIVLIVVAAGCGSTPGPSGTPSAAVSTFDNEVMTFEYPGNWNALVPEAGDPALVLLSTEQLAPVEPRIEALGNDGVYIAWTEASAAPVATPRPSAGTDVDVGGRPAVLTRESADGDCAGIGGDQLLVVRIDSPSTRPDVQMQACTRGPNFELTSATIAGMLASVDWKD